MEVNNTKFEVFKAYLKSDGKDIEKIAKKFNISRQAVYQHIRAVRAGERNKQIAREVKVGILWETRYKQWYAVIPKTFKNGTELNEYKCLVRAMKKSGFTLVEIGKLLKKDHTTIGYHVNKK